ncbi:DUF2577 domain-containing protein [Geobacillus thermoleovorans]|uniref:DUF2577 domain-containing protein n=1 Tax=Geobacillus thermoleovorans TaxID=33941 RepID=UPI00204BD09A|nr:DUF2577 domain-containing protein [Geobacillus thermoleovorans]UPT60471.1 DUF2577 domain-containing protein [Geobacillus thermoleovorans]
MRNERIEGGPATRLIQLIQRYGYNKDVDFELATVVSPPPDLRIKFDQYKGIILEKDDLVVCEHLTQHTRRLTDGTTLTFETALKVGDRVIVACMDERQLFIVVDKAVTF